MEKIKFKIIMAVVLAFMVNGAVFAQSQDFKEFLKLFNVEQKPYSKFSYNMVSEVISENLVNKYISKEKRCPYCGIRKPWWVTGSLFTVDKYYVGIIYNRCTDYDCVCDFWMYVYSQDGKIIDRKNLMSGYKRDPLLCTFRDVFLTNDPFSFKFLYGRAKNPETMENDLIDCNVDTYLYTISPEGKIIRKVIKKNEDLIWKNEPDGKSAYHKPSKELMEAIRAQEAANK